MLATGVNRPYQISDQPDFTLITIKPITTDPLVTALILVESQGNDSAIGDTHLTIPSIGCLSSLSNLFSNDFSSFKFNVLSI